ncbi:MAG: FdtA/QdtA family cupin domain-containing protein [Francisellaceae bacterium]|jgi:dTDP-4-dehydrorhamnose 3,5-epimerase-like enzyme|nr:FdtA/QdtA family cupin domain-containing protein [Francisellaceae bacterium]MBT6207766.1 FdtA/QdtA family cupin domain-containing protein [Francisellaceae bacterium]MBT6539078.1 FdtA/QdtA family cupin domain-containing protein [Francisellaceae bacterium]
MPITVNDIKVITFPNQENRKAQLSIYDTDSSVPFDIKRVFCINSREKLKRGDHAHKECLQILICLSGAIKVICDDKKRKKEFLLDSSHKGLLVPAMIWATQDYIESSSILMVLCSHSYNEEDYIRDYQRFLKC